MTVSSTVSSACQLQLFIGATRPEAAGDANSGRARPGAWLMGLAGWWVERRRRRARRRAPVGVRAAPVDVDPLELADVDVRLAAIAADASYARDVRLAASLRPLVERRTPARVVEVAQGLGTARVRFADGTAVLVEGDVPGDVAILARWMQRGSVVPIAVLTMGDGTHVRFRTSTRRELSLRVTGLDQPD